MKSFKGVLETFDDVFAAHHGVIDSCGRTLVDLSADNDGFTSHIEVLEGLTHLGFSFTHAVNLSGVIEIDTQIKALFNSIPGEVKGGLVVRVKPVAITKY